MKFTIKEHKKHTPQRLRTEDRMVKSTGEILQEPKQLMLWDKWLAVLPKMTDEKQKAAGRHILIFFAAMLILTIAARGISGATYAKVTVDKLKGGQITESISGMVTISLSDVNEIPMPEGVKVKQYLTSVGQTVKEGDSLLQVDITTLSEDLQKLNSQISFNQLELQELQTSTKDNEPQAQSLQKSLNRLLEDNQATMASLDKTVQQAEKALTEANNKLETAKQRLAEEQQKPVISVPTTPANNGSGDTPELAPEPTKPSDLSSYEDDVQQAQAAVSAAAEAVDSAKEARQSAIKSMNRQVDDSKESIAKAQESDAKASTQNEIDKQKKNLTENAKQKEIDKLKATATAWQTLFDNGGVIKSTQKGNVKSLPPLDTETTAETTIQLLNIDGTFKAEMQLRKSDAQKVQNGTEVALSKESNSFYDKSSPIGTVLAISEPSPENNMVTLQIQLPEGKWKANESLTGEIVQSSKKYDNCVPLAALHSDDRGSFILAVEERSTILGIENVLVPYYVKISAQNNSIAALEGSTPYGIPIVTESTKPIKAGDRVRINEEKN